MENDLLQRKATRLAQWDYNSDGAYFLTICTRDRTCLLSAIVGGGVLDAPHVALSHYGSIVDNQLQVMNALYPHLQVDKYVVMPNHIHLILLTRNNGTSRTPSPTNAAVPRWVSTFKRYVHRQCGCLLFQRSYHDHIIRSQRDYQRIWQYIDTNPVKWECDCFYPIPTQRKESST